MDEFEVGRVYNLEGEFFRYLGGAVPDRASWQKIESALEPESVDIERPGKARGLLAKLLQGPTFGTSDEIGAAVKAIPALVPGGRTPQQAFGENLSAARQGLRATSEDIPKTALATELAGAVGGGLAQTLLTGGALGPTALANVGKVTARQLPKVAGQVAGRAATRAVGKASQQALRPIVGTGLQSGLFAAGTAEGGLGDRAKRAAIAAPVGLALGGGLRLGGKVGSVGLDFIGRPEPATSALGKLSQRFVDNTEKRAAAKLEQALARSGETAEEVVERAFPGETMMDIGGREVRELSGAAVRVRSRGANQIMDALDERAAKSADLTLKNLRDKTGLTVQEATASLEELTAAKAANAAPLYDAAYAQSVPKDVVDDVLKIPAFREAYETGRRIAALDNVTFPPINELGDAVPVQAIDMMKQGLDDLIGGRAGSASAVGRNEGRLLRKRLNSLLNEVDEAVPEYAAARAQYAGDAAAQEAFEEGFRVYRLGPSAKSAPSGEALDRMLAKMSPSEREFFQRGGLEGLTANLESVTDFGRIPDVTRLVVGNSRLKGRVRRLFNSDEAFDGFFESASRQRNQAQARQNIQGGSSTAGRLGAMVDLTGTGGLENTVDAANRFGLLRIIKRLAGQRVERGAAGTVNQLAPMLTQDLFGGGGKTLLEKLAQFNSQEAARRAAGRGVRSIGAFGVGNVAGGGR